VERIDVQPQVLTMDREKVAKDPNHDVRLTVRAKDGSEFWFDELEIHYQLTSAMVGAMLAKHGRGDGYKNAVRTHARQVLRDEFGRYTFLEAADPSSYQTATAEAPRPRFDQNVEQAINDRQTAQQEVRVQQRERERLVKKRDRRVQTVRQTKNAELQSLKARLEAEFKQAEAQLVETRTAADTFAIGRRAEADAEKQEKITRAAGIRVAATERARGLQAEIEAIGAQGPGMLDRTIAELVMPQIERVGAVPYQKARHPVDIRHIQTGARGQ